MSETRLEKAAVAALATAALTARSEAAEHGEVGSVIEQIRKHDDAARAEAWASAATIGAPAVNPLAAMMAEDDSEIARAARRGLWKIVRHVGRPGADNERKPVVAELMALLAEGQPASVRREVMWMVSEIAGDEAVDPVAALLSNEELREDARMVLERLPGQRSLGALKRALGAVPREFKINIAQSLRARGIRVRGFPCQKLVPTRKTDLNPVE